MAEERDVESEYTLTLAIPGVRPSDLEVAAKAGSLTVHGETKHTGARIAKTVHLPQDADWSRASATCIDGLLSIDLPKKPEAGMVTLTVSKDDGEDTGGEDHYAMDR